ncbi:sodium:solute symporter [Clostridiales bacterium]|nr:sodium:solute symporter [Clostridiales bacterium]
MEHRGFFHTRTRKEGLSVSFGELALKLGMLLVFFGVMIYVGFYCRKHSTDVNGFVLGGRNVGPWLTAFAYGTSYFSAVIFVGYAGQFGWKFGIASTWVGIGNALIGSLLAWVILGRRTRVMTQHLSSATMPDFFEKRFSATSLKIAASIIIFIFMIPYTASLYNGLSRLFRMAFGIDYSVCVIVMAVLTAVYVIVGGYMATAVNDFIQGIIMLFGIVAVIGAVLGNNGGFIASLNGLAAAQDPSIANGDVPGIFNSFFGPDPLSLLGVVLLTSLGTWGLPQMVGKFYAIRSEGAIHKGTIISTFFAIVVAGGCYFLGGFGRLFSDKIDIAANGYDSIIPTMLESLSPFLIAVVIILVLSASMSTLSSLVLTSSSTVTLDLLKGKLMKKMDEKKQLLVMRILIVVFIVISAALAIVQAKSSVAFIAQAMGVSWGAMAGAFLAPFLYGLYWKRTTKAGCWASMVFSTVFMIIDMLGNLKVINVNLGLLQSPINAGAFCMIAGLVLVPLVSLITKAPSKDQVDAIFACYDRKVLVSAKDSIEVAEDA